MCERTEKQIEKEIFLKDEFSSSPFARDVREGLSKSKKTLPCVYFYDEKGSLLFEEICSLSEYYPTRTEASILRQNADEMASLFLRDVNIIELGSGSSVKTRVLLEAFLRKNRMAVYKPIDVSNSILQESSAHLERAYPGLRVFPAAGRYEEGFKKSILHNGKENLILWLGSSIGNYEREEAVKFLKSLRQLGTGNTKFLIGIDLRKEKNVLENAYDDSKGITAAFNLNLLERINRELNGDFNLQSFRHSAVYDETTGKVEMRLVSTKQQAVTIADCGIEIYFDEGETIHTENSIKYSLNEIEALAAGSGLAIERQWFDQKKWFSLNLFCAS